MPKNNRNFEKFSIMICFSVTNPKKIGIDEILTNSKIKLKEVMKNINLSLFFSFDLKSYKV